MRERAGNEDRHDYLLLENKNLKGLKRTQISGNCLLGLMSFFSVHFKVISFVLCRFYHELSF